MDVGGYAAAETNWKHKVTPDWGDFIIQSCQDMIIILLIQSCQDMIIILLIQSRQDIIIILLIKFRKEMLVIPYGQDILLMQFSRIW